MRVFCHIPRENWFCDRYGDEYSRFSRHQVTHIDLNSDIIWLLAAWCWNQIPVQYLASKKVVCTIHHEVPWKFNEQRLNTFKERDQFVDVYHVPCHQTKEFISKYTNKPVIKIGYWCNNYLWKNFQETKEEIKKSFNLPIDRMIISSFQRDTEGSDLKSPKLEKGPDIFCDVVESISKERDVHVLLNGWRRQYVITELEKRSIPYTYYELPDIDNVVKMYSATDLYVVGARVEGGPQSLLECSVTKTPIISTDVGMAKDVISHSCITNDFSDIKNLIQAASDAVEENYNNVQKFLVESHVKKYDDLFESILKD